MKKMKGEMKEEYRKKIVGEIKKEIRFKLDDIEKCKQW